MRVGAATVGLLAVAACVDWQACARCAESQRIALARHSWCGLRVWVSSLRQQPDREPHCVDGYKDADKLYLKRHFTIGK